MQSAAATRRVAPEVEEEKVLSDTQVIRVTVWGENQHEKTNEKVRSIYPDGMHTVIADGIRNQLGENRVHVRAASGRGVSGVETAGLFAIMSAAVIFRFPPL